jgi:hypothetical protein
MYSTIHCARGASVGILICFSAMEFLEWVGYYWMFSEVHHYRYRPVAVRGCSR